MHERKYPNENMNNSEFLSNFIGTSDRPNFRPA
jgi:hypothetical protein